MWGIRLDVDFKCNFVVVDEAPLWIGHILKCIIAKQLIFLRIAICSNERIQPGPNKRLTKW